MDKLLNSTFYKKYLSSFYNNSIAVMILSLFCVLYFAIFGGVFAVTGEFTRIGGEILELFGMDLSSYSYYQKQNLNGTILTRVDGVMIIGMCFGCLMAAAFSNKIAFRKIASKTRFFQALIGGILAGFGARLAWGCNLANFFTGLPYFSLHTWVFAIFMCIGVYTAILLVKIPIFSPKAKMIKVTSSSLKIDKNRQKKSFIFACILSFIFALVFVLFLLFAVKVNLAIALLFGAIFGWLIQKGQICFTSCFRDLFLFKRADFAIALFFSMFIASFFVYALLNNGLNAKVLEISIGLCVGAFLFGFGIVFAGGCECGFFYRMLEGQSHFFVVGVGNILGTMLIALNYDKLPKWFLNGEKIKFSGTNSLLIESALFLISIFLIYLYSRMKNV